jgi:hypothetical protein
MFPSSGEERETPILLGHLERGPVIDVSPFSGTLTSPESSYLEFRTMNKIHKSSDSEVM